MYRKVKPHKLICFLNDIGIIIHGDFEIEKITIENQFLKPKIFTSHSFGQYAEYCFQYRITSQKFPGEIIVDDFYGRLQLIKNTLTEDY